MEEMTLFDTLIILRRDHEEIPAQLGLAVGFAIARRLEVIWIGVPLERLSQFPNVPQFRSVPKTSVARRAGASRKLGTCSPR